MPAKKVSIHEVLKLNQGGMESKVPISPQDVSNQYPANPRKPLYIAGF
jgi:hypothetical protein